MTALSNSDLTYMREAIENLLPGTCNILEITQTSDGQGGFTESWGTATATVSCRLDALRGEEILQGGAVQPQHRYVLTLAQDETIAATNRVEIGSDTFSVISVDDDKSWAASRRVYLERI